MSSLRDSGACYGSQSLSFGSDLLVLQQSAGLCDDVFHCESEMLEQILNRSGGAEVCSGDDASVEANVLAPTQSCSRFHGDTRTHQGRQDLISIFGRLLFKDLPRWHADDPGTNAFRLELFVSADAQLHLRAGA